MNSNLNTLIDFFKYQNQLKTVLRNNWMPDGRKESSAEHSWSVAMMTWLLIKPLEEEFSIKLDVARTIQMALVHDIVEIDAGDVAAWDSQGREDVKNKEALAIELISKNLNHVDENQIYQRWIEHDKLETIESKLVKACDQLCPLVYRIVFHNSYQNTLMNRQKLDGIFLPIVSFSQTTSKLYLMLAEELEQKELFDKT